MPLGLFGSSVGKPQPLTDASASSSGVSAIREKKDTNCKGVTLKLTNTQVTIEKQIAEGGFAIVYLVTDRKNRKFALKRQFVLDNRKQLDACIQECKIVSELRGHKNIIEYVDHMITTNKSGQFDCMLLTVYHKRNVLQLMNERISNNSYLSSHEVLNIFCDMCEAVARLHHSKTPVIHRDLKVENILIDERNRAAPPIFVLCDFGSATTTTMSINTHPASVIQEEIERNTTLCYRSPEMVDIYGGQTIGIKSDMWSLGVMLYRLCYFSLPFEESALAIQNGIYSAFPENPEYPAAIRAIIYLLLDVDVSRRLSIFECASLAFDAYGKALPIENVHGVAKPSLERAIIEFREGRPRNRAQSLPLAEPLKPVIAAQGQQQQQLLQQQGAAQQPTSTSVNPRLRPKANNPTKIAGPLVIDAIKPADFGFTDLENAQIEGVARDRAATWINLDGPPPSQSNQHRRNVSDTSQIAKSAFKPYSQTTPTAVQSVENMTSSVPCSTTTGRQEWNPFLAAPLDDHRFGEAFDELPRRKERRGGGGSEDDDDDGTSSIDSRDPFGAAPFDKKTAADVQQQQQEFSFDNDHKDEDSEVDEQRMHARRRFSYENIDGVGDDASSDSRGRTDRDDSEEEEEEESNDDDDDDDEDSQNTVGSGEEGGNRPLLEDDGLEDDDDRDLLLHHSFHATISPITNITNNPFLRDETMTPKLDICYAPATLPRQATPLAAVARFKPELPANGPVSIIPSMSTTSFPEVEPPSEGLVTTSEPAVVGTLIEVAPEEPPPPPPKPKPRGSVPIDFVEGPRTPKPSKKTQTKKGAKSRGSVGPQPDDDDVANDPETDGSEAEMCAESNGGGGGGGGGASGKRKKKGAFGGLRGASHPSIAAADLHFVAPIPPVVKKSKDKKSSSTSSSTSSSAKRASTGTLNNSSFVNTSFQFEADS